LAIYLTGMIATALVGAGPCLFFDLEPGERRVELVLSYLFAVALWPFFWAYCAGNRLKK